MKRFLLSIVALCVVSCASDVDKSKMGWWQSQDNGEYRAVSDEPVRAACGDATSTAVAPADAGPHNSVVPGIFGGNIDCPDLAVGTTLYLPVLVKGARFYVGDSHAAQGCGEVNQTAIETSMPEARLRLSVVDAPRLQRPRAETADHLITFGIDQDLRTAATQAIADMVALLEAERGLTAAQAYTLCSIAVDLAVTQVVNHAQGVHARLPKKVFYDV